MADNGQTTTQFACKCLNIRLNARRPQDTPPPVETGFRPVYVGEEGIRVAHTEVTLRSRSKAIPVSGSPTTEFTRYMTMTCLICGLLAYRVAQRITPDLSTEEGPVLPTDDWVEKELCKSSTGWIEVSQACMTREDISQAEVSPMYSKSLLLVLPGGTPPSTAAASQSSEDEPSALPNVRGPSEHGTSHLPELPPVFLPPPFSPSHVVFSHFSAVASEQSQKIRDEAEECIAQMTERKVAEVRQAEAALKQEVYLVWNRFKESLRLYEQTANVRRPNAPPRRRSSVSGHNRSTSNPAIQGTSASVRITNFVPSSSHSTRVSPSSRPVQSALAASLKTTGFHYPEAQRQLNGNGSASSSPRSANSTPSSDHGQTSPIRSSITRVHSPSTASTRTAALDIDVETSIREAHRREIDESKDMATSYRYVMDLEAQMEQQRSDAEAEAAISSPPPPVASPSQANAGTQAATAARGHSPRIHRSAIKRTSTAERSKSPKEMSQESAHVEAQKDVVGKGKRKVTFDVKPEVAFFKDESEGELGSGQTTPLAANGAYDIFDMDNESESALDAPVELLTEQTRNPPPLNPERVLSPPHSSHSRSYSGGLPPELSALRPASLPAPSAMRPPQRHPLSPTAELTDRSRALRESLVAPVEAQRSRPEVVRSPIEITPTRSDRDEPHDPREEEILRLVAASTPSHRSAWKRNSKAWQVFLSRRERRTAEVGNGIEPISEEGNYVLDDFNPQSGRRYNEVMGSDVTDEDEDDNDDPDHPIAQSLPIAMGPLSKHRTAYYQPKTSLSDHPGMLVPPLRAGNGVQGSVRASYAERDPGAMDFFGDVEYDDDDVESDPESGGKARQRAFRILKARNELPEAGMWRSLA